MSGAERISTQEDFSTPAHARRAFLAEGDHQPLARMVLEVDGLKVLQVRRGGKVVKGSNGVDLAMQKMLTASMRTPKPH